MPRKEIEVRSRTKMNVIVLFDFTFAVRGAVREKLKYGHREGR